MESNEHNRNEMNAVVFLLGDVLVELQGQRKAFDTTMNLVLDKLNKLDTIEQEIVGIRADLRKYHDLADRVTKLEETVYRKGA